MGFVGTERREQFTTGQLADLLGTSRRTIARYIDQGKIRARRTAGGWNVIPRKEVVDFLWDAGYDRRIPPVIRLAAEKAYARLTRAPG